eukprot:5552811-Prymnesium_polylepis.1
MRPLTPRRPASSSKRAIRVSLPTSSYPCADVSCATASVLSVEDAAASTIAVSSFMPRRLKNDPAATATTSAIARPPMASPIVASGLPTSEQGVHSSPRPP